MNRTITAFKAFKIIFNVEQYLHGVISFKQIKTFEPNCYREEFFILPEYFKEKLFHFYEFHQSYFIPMVMNYSETHIFDIMTMISDIGYKKLAPEEEADSFYSSILAYFLENQSKYDRRVNLDDVVYDAFKNSKIQPIYLFYYYYGRKAEFNEVNIYRIFFSAMEELKMSNIHFQSVVKKLKENIDDIFKIQNSMIQYQTS